MDTILSVVDAIWEDRKMKLSLIRAVTVYQKEEDGTIKKLPGKWIGFRPITNDPGFQDQILFVSRLGEVAYLRGHTFSKRKVRRKLLVRIVDDYDETTVLNGLRALHRITHLPVNTDYPQVRV